MTQPRPEHHLRERVFRALVRRAHSDPEFRALAKHLDFLSLALILDDVVDSVLADEPIGKVTLEISWLQAEMHAAPGWWVVI